MTCKARMEEIKAQLKGLGEFKDKLSVFMNMDYIRLTTQAESLDEFMRKRMEANQTTLLMLANENSNKTLMDTLAPLETRMTAQIDNLVRDHAAMRGYLTKINEVVNDIAAIEEKLAVRPTIEDIDAKMDKFKDYTTIKAFQGLQRIVSQKAEGIQQDEMRVQLDAT